MSERSGQRQPAAELAVFRLGLGQRIYLGWAPAVAVLAGIGVILAAIEPQAQDRVALVGVGIAMAGCGAFFLAYLFGMSIEVDEECVSKVYMFGLTHVAIPLQYLSASTATEYSSSPWFDWEYKRLDFESSDGVGDGFSAYPFWVWRRHDMDKLRALATSMAAWRASHPMPARPEPPPTSGSFFKLAGQMTYVGGLLAAVPLTFLYLKWGGLATLTIACVIELALIGLSARLTWRSRSVRVHPPRPRGRQ